ncbi:hypothetical protein FKW77_006042 [Venturia effusa]|uniref:Uncharacterized protein n=1 Tax=Venturia effusa TaxID=50376 RepID=A0A517L9F4_9PEZI|nr:hypothetical protein FKW77_006042 [Venturia effusa]
MPLGPHPSEMPEWNAAWVLYRTGKYDDYVRNFKMACEKWETNARLTGERSPPMFSMTKVASAIATPKVLRGMYPAATMQQAQMDAVGEARRKQHYNSEDNVETMHMGSGPRAGSNPNVRCGLENFEFVNGNPGQQAENGQPEVEQAAQKKSSWRLW